MAKQFFQDWPYVYSLALQSPIAGKYSISQWFMLRGTTAELCLGGWGLGISESSKHPDAAWQVIKFLSSEDSQREFILETGFVPSRKLI